MAAAAESARVFCNVVDDPQHCSYITPAVVDRGPVVVAVSSGGSAPVLARRLRASIEALLPQRIGSLAELSGRWRARVAARLPDLRERLRFWERFFGQGFFDSPAARSALAGDVDAAEAELAALLDAADGAATPGEAWLVGAGPGDPDLLTLAALRALQAADLVLYDRLVPPAIVDLARRDAERVAVGKRPGGQPGDGCVPQEEINRRLVEAVSAGLRVCRLKGGDPFIFGRGGEEAAALQAAGLRFRVIPGITAATGCAAAAGIPLTLRNVAHAVTFVTGHRRPGAGGPANGPASGPVVDAAADPDWDALAADAADPARTLVIYMGVRRYPELMRELVARGRAADTPVAIIERGTTPRQRVVRGTLGQLAMLAAAHAVESPALLIIGKVAAVSGAVQDTRPDIGAPRAALPLAATHQG